MTKAIQAVGMESMEVKNVKVTEYGIEVEGSLTPEQWCDAVQKVGKYHSRAQFYLGDLVVYAEGINNTWGDKYDELVELTGYENQTLRNYASVCRKFDVGVREDVFVRAGGQLTFKHFEIVQSLEPETAKYFLQVAGEAGWSTRRLAEEVQRHKNNGRLPETARGQELPDGWEEIKQAKRFGGYVPAPKSVDRDIPSYLIELQEWEINKLLMDYKNDSKMLSLIERLQTAIK